MSRKDLYLALAIFVLTIIGACAFVSSKVAVARADQVKQDMAPVHEQAAQEKQSALKSEDGNQKALMATLAAIAAQKQQPVATPVDYARIEQMIEQRMGVQATVKPDPSLPNAPSATMPAKQLRDYMLDCDEAHAGLTSCRVTTVNLSKQLQAEQDDHAATKKELTAARTAMKGGSFFHRLKSNSRWLIIGGITGAVATTALKH